jgi:hypothetical protein
MFPIDPMRFWAKLPKNGIPRAQLLLQSPQEQTAKCNTKPLFQLSAYPDLIWAQTGATAILSL